MMKESPVCAEIQNLAEQGGDSEAGFTDLPEIVPEKEREEPVVSPRELQWRLWERQGKEENVDHARPARRSACRSSLLRVGN